jgi:phage repressor protein C with HTH and peptisase S24 domain
MAPRYYPGETVLLDRAAPTNGDHVFVVLTPAAAKIHRRSALLRQLKAKDRRGLTLVQYNPRRSQEISRSKIAAIYRVIPGTELVPIS